MCGDDTAAPDINKDDVSKDKNNQLPDGITASDGQEALNAAGLEPRLMEAFGGRTFEGIWPEVSGIQRDTAPSSLDEKWRGIGEQLHTSVLAFERDVKSLKENGDWEGKTIEAAFNNAIESISEPFYTGTAALRGAELVHKFRDTFNYVYDNLVKDPLGEFDNMYQRYEHDRDNARQPIETAPGQQGYYYEDTTEEEKEQVRQYYNEYMRIVMNDSYKPNINAIYSGYPHFKESTAAAEPIDIPGLPEKPAGPGDGTGGGDTSPGGGGGPSFGGGGGPGLGGGMPTLPKTPGPSLPTGLGDGLTDLPKPGDINGPGQPDNPSLPDPSNDPSQAIGPATGLANGLANGASKALGSAAQAAKAPTGGLPGSGGPKPKIPEGALALGKGGPGSTTGGGGKGGGGAGIGGLPKELSRLPGLAAAATQADAAGAARPAVGTGAGAMGPPGTPGGAGHGAGGQQGKEHKANKVLRSRQNGTEIAGEAEAVVPVIGEDQGQGTESRSQERRQPAETMEREHREQVVQRARPESEARQRQQMVPPEDHR